MCKIIKSLLLFVFIITFSIQAKSETSWITKKSDKSEKEIKLEQKAKKVEVKKKNKLVKKENKRK